MNKSLLFLLLFFSFNIIFAQTSWELLNPKPTEQTGIDVHFVSATNGFFITSSELFFTIDSGGTWQLKTEFAGAKDMVFNEDTGIIVQNSGSVLITIDYGETWTSHSVGAAENLNSATVLDGETFIVSGPQSVFISKNRGQSWEQMSLPDSGINKTVFTDVLTGHAVSNDGRIFKTEDGAETWYTTWDGSNIIPNSFFTVYFIDSTTGFASKEHNDVLKTTDGGETWVEVSPGSTDAIQEFYFIDDQTGFAAAEYGVLKTTNGGIDWSRIGVEKNGRYVFTDAFGVYFFDENKGFIVGQRGRIANTNNSGDDWEIYSPQFFGTVKQIEVLPNDHVIALEGQNLYKSVNDGLDWEYLSTPLEDASPVTFDFVDENIGYTIAGLYTSTHKVYKTTNGGETWVATTNSGLYFDNGGNDLYFLNENLGFASGGYNQKRTYKTIDGGQSWEVVITENLSSIQFVNETVGYGIRTGYSNHIVFKTTDAGETWTNVFEIDDDIESIQFLDENNGYFIGDPGIAYRTYDGGETWHKLEFPYGYFERLYFYTPNIGYALNDDGQIYKTDDGWLSWSNIGSFYGIADMAFNDQGEIFVSGGYGRIYKSSITYRPIVLEVSEPEEITGTSAKMQANLASNNNQITDLTLVYYTDPTAVQSMSLNPRSIPGKSNASFAIDIEGLEFNTRYNYRLKAVHEGSEHITPWKNFTTLPEYNITTNLVSFPGSSTVEVSAVIQANNTSLTDIAFEYGVDPSYFDQAEGGIPDVVNKEDGQVTAEAFLTGLTPETEYYLRARAVYNGDTIYSEVQSFKTNPEFSVRNWNPNVQKAISQVGLSANVTVHEQGLSEIVFEYGVDSLNQYQIAQPDSIAPNSSRSINTQITDLDTTKLYQYRVRAILNNTKVYGPIGYFSFNDQKVIKTAPAENVKRRTADISGVVFSSTDFITGIQFNYGTEGEFTRQVFTSPGYTGNGNSLYVSGSLTELIPGTTYNYILKGMTSEGEIQSDTLYFTTKEAPGYDNFKISVTSETCPDKNNGSLTIETLFNSDYTLVMGENSYGFNEQIELTDLEPGDYEICITEAEEPEPFCFQFTVMGSEALEAKVSTETSKSSTLFKVNVSQGSAPFMVLINGKEFKTFATREFTFQTRPGDQVSIFSNKDCEGELSFKAAEDISRDVFMNPVLALAEFRIPENDQDVEVVVFDISGRVIYSKTKYVKDHSLQINVNSYQAGMYFVRIAGESIRTHKIIKQ